MHSGRNGSGMAGCLCVCACDGALAGACGCVRVRGVIGGVMRSIGGCKGVR